MNELESKFDKEYEKYFKSKSMDKIQEGLDIARSNGAFVFMPSPMLSHDQSVYMPIIDRVFLREDEIYASKKKFRIHFNGLLRMSIAAAFEWSSIDCCRIDKQNDKLYCAFQGVGGVRKADGRVYFHQAKDDIDIEVLEMEFEDKYNADWEKVKDCKGDQAWKRHGHNKRNSFVAAMVRRDIIQKRKNMTKLAESGAKSRVIRFVLGLQSEYANKNQLIGMPFVFVYYAMNQFHEAIKPLLMSSAPKMISQVYGGSNDIEPADHVNIRQNIIDVEDEEPDHEEQEPESDTPEFEPAEHPEPENGNLIDFQNSNIEDQIKTLKAMCKAKGEDFQGYEKKLKKKKSPGIWDIDQEWRDNFFTYLNNIELKDGKK